MSNSLSLYNIASEIVELNNLRDEAELEGDAESVKAIDAQVQVYVRDQLAAKADGIRGILKHLAVQVVEWQEEANRFTALAKKARDDSDRLKAYVLDAMHLLDTKKIEGSKGDVLLRRMGNGGVKPLVIAQPELVPRDCKKIVVTMNAEDWDSLCLEDTDGMKIELSVNPSEIRHRLERGGGVLGCRLAERGEHLEVS